MNTTNRSHKWFSIVMLILIVGGVLAAFATGVYNMYSYQKQKSEKEALYSQLADAASETASSEN